MTFAARFQPQSPRRALIFRVPGEESATNARRLAHTARKSGLDVEIVPYWPDGHASEEEVPLLAENIGSAPRLTARQFRRRFHFKLDLIDLSIHQFVIEPITPRMVLPESDWSQHLRGVGALAHRRIRASRADVVLVPHGAETVSRILAEMTAKARRRLLYWESGFFPGHLYVDARSPHFFRGEASIDHQPMPEQPSASTIAFRDAWRSDRTSKYVQPPHSAGAQVSTWLAGDDRPILFLPGQTPHDANVAVALGRFPDLASLYRDVLAQIPETWRILYKPHPRASQDPLAEYAASSGRFLNADINIHDAIDASRAVLTLSSNVGLEALIRGRPVILLGKPVYWGRGLTLDLADHASLKTLLHANDLKAPSEANVLLLLELLLTKGQLADDDSLTLQRLLRDARRDTPKRRLPCYGAAARTMAYAARQIAETLPSDEAKSFTSPSPEWNALLQRTMATVDASPPERWTNRQFWFRRSSQPLH